MVIAVDIGGQGKYPHFIYETFKIITPKYPPHSFLFIFSTPYDASFIFSENVIPVIVPERRISLLKRLKISSLLKKYEAGVFITMQPLKTKVPQVILAYDKCKVGSVKNNYMFIADSQFSKKEITDRHLIETDRIEVIYNGADEIFKPLHKEEREKIKGTYTDGIEYFFSGGIIPADNLMHLLKAFSTFKKMQKSNMQLILATEKEFAGEFLEKLALFKYKNEVKALANIDKNELAAITAGAYAFVYPVPAGGYSYPLQSMKCDVPVITGNTGALPEICGDAVLYIDPGDQKDIADKMMLLYKDEKLRLELIQKGNELVKKYSWDTSASLLWKNIEKAAM